MRITLEQYLMDRHKLYDCPQEVRDNAKVMVDKVNALLAVLETQNVPLEAHPKTLSIVASGWRPEQINRQTKNAAVKSKHITGQACDLYDPEGAVDDFLLTEPGKNTLAALGLYLEHPSSTRNWSHVQIVPPRSGNRIFFP